MRVKIAIIAAVSFFILLMLVATLGIWAVNQKFAVNEPLPRFVDNNASHVVFYDDKDKDKQSADWNGDYFWVGGDINIEGAHAGALIDTWTADTYLNNGYKYSSGQPLCISIYNNTDEPKKFEIGLEDTIGQPDGFQDWITVADYYPSVPARTVADVPIKIVIPDSAANVHGNFEFRIYVVSSEGSIQSAGAIRIFVSMR